MIEKLGFQKIKKASKAAIDFVKILTSSRKVRILFSRLSCAEQSLSNAHILDPHSVPMLVYHEEIGAPHSLFILVRGFPANERWYDSCIYCL